MGRAAGTDGTRGGARGVDRGVDRGRLGTHEGAQAGPSAPPWNHSRVITLARSRSRDHAVRRCVQAVPSDNAITLEAHGDAVAAFAETFATRDDAARGAPVGMTEADAHRRAGSDRSDRIATEPPRRTIETRQFDDGSQLGAEREDGRAPGDGPSRRLATIAAETLSEAITTRPGRVAEEGFEARRCNCACDVDLHGTGCGFGSCRPTP